MDKTENNAKMSSTDNTGSSKLKYLPRTVPRLSSGATPAPKGHSHPPDTRVEVVQKEHPHTHCNEGFQRADDSGSEGKEDGGGNGGPEDPSDARKISSRSTAGLLPEDLIEVPPRLGGQVRCECFLIKQVYSRNVGEYDMSLA